MQNKFIKSVQIKTNGIFIRNHQAIDLLELFFISTISTFLATRGYLNITGFPQIGGGNLHFAHLLWGGLFMLLAVFIYIIFISKGSKKAATIIAGIGFGLFIDEIGKFITSNNDYFFKPSIALIYICFIIIFLIIKFFQNFSNLSSTTYSLNALSYLQDIILNKFDEHKREKALFLIKSADQSDPITKAISKLILDSKYKKNRNSKINESKLIIKQLLLKILRSRIFQILIIIYFILASLFWLFIGAVAVFELNFKLDFITMAYVISAISSGIIALFGIYKLIRKNKIVAYQFFILSILISIFISQVFLFIIDQLSSITTLFQNIIIYFALKVKLEELNNNL